MSEADAPSASSIARVQVHRAARSKNASKRIRQRRGTGPDDSKPLLICLRPGTSLIQ